MGLKGMEVSVLGEEAGSRVPPPEVSTVVGQGWERRCPGVVLRPASSASPRSLLALQNLRPRVFTGYARTCMQHVFRKNWHKEFSRG